jgi:glycosyltransferase involved in cell wall biosynthesis
MRSSDVAGQVPIEDGGRRERLRDAARQADAPDRQRDGTPLRILIATESLRRYTGTELYSRDLALGLRAAGHAPAVYVRLTGSLSDDLQAAGIPVITNLRRVPWRPQVIHGHHRATTLLALAAFRDVPALYLCHNHAYWLDRTPLHPRVRRYLGVSRLCIARMKQERAPADAIAFAPNWVDVDRFLPRRALPRRPGRALVFSNYASDETHLPAVRKACRRAGLTLDVIGHGAGNVVAAPERILGQYDLVFAKAKAAIEAMACGAAVVLCDFGGLGSMVTAANYDSLRTMNFGFEALNRPLTADLVLAEIQGYDADDAARVRDRVREEASLTGAVQALLNNYRAVIALQREVPAGSSWLSDLAKLTKVLPRLWLAERLWQLRTFAPPADPTSLTVPSSFRRTAV